MATWGAFPPGSFAARMTAQHYVHNGVPDFHKRMQELEAEHARVSALPREKPKVSKIATGKTFQQHWEDMDDEQRHAYFKSADVSVLVIRKEDSLAELSCDGSVGAASPWPSQSPSYSTASRSSCRVPA